MNTIYLKVALWGVAGIIWSFFSFQGGAEAIMSGLPVSVVFGTAFGSPLNVIKGLATGALLAGGRYIFYVNKGK